MLETGDPAPNFTLPADDGPPVELATLLGKPVAIFFYPKDDTEGCTAEAKDFSQLATRFEKAGVEVIGVSPDSAASHRRFKANHGLTVRLASDQAKEAAEAYGVWVEKSMYGRTYMGTERATFLVDASGRIARRWRKVKVPGHAEEVLAAAMALQDGTGQAS